MEWILYYCVYNTSVAKSLPLSSSFFEGSGKFAKYKFSSAIKVTRLWDCQHTVLSYSSCIKIAKFSSS